jgi:hypothetical protein
MRSFLDISRRPNLIKKDVSEARKCFQCAKRVTSI